jgi:hypothetical protein
MVTSLQVVRKEGDFMSNGFAITCWKRKSFLFWSFFAVSDIESCYELNLYKVAVINLMLCKMVSSDFCSI